MDGGGAVSEELYKALFNDLRADIREQLKALHNLPNGEEKALREAEVMMRVMKRIDMESVEFVFPVSPTL